MDRVVVFSDLHVGSVVGLWPPGHRVEGGGRYVCNPFQDWLYRCWQRMMTEMQGLDAIVVCNGDEIQGTSPRDGQLVTNKVDIQAAAAFELLQPVRVAARKFYMLRGTEWHVGKSAEFTEGLARRLNAETDPSEANTWWELYLKMGSNVIHFAHHVGTSSVPWYEATIPLRDTLMLLAELDRFFGAEAPNVRLVVRSHRHRFIHVHAPPDLQVVVTPSWQLRTAFSYKRSSSMLPQIGYVLLEWDGTDLMVKPRIFPLPALHIEEV